MVFWAGAIMNRIRALLQNHRMGPTGETAEFAVVAALIVVTAAAVMATMGGTILARCLEVAGRIM
jgi:hypothetical protein